MQGEAWATIGVGLTVAGGMFGTWWSNRAQNAHIEAKVDTAATVAAAANTAAEVAAANTEHVSNGFAAGMTSGIGQLLAGQARLEASLERLAEAHGRTVGRLDETAGRLNRHLDPPAHGTSPGADGVS